MHEDAALAPSSAPDDTRSDEPVLLPPADLARGDPLLYWLQRRGYSPAVVAAGLALGLTALRMAAAADAGLLFRTEAPVGFFNDPAMYAHVAIGAIFFAYWTWLPRGISEMYEGLAANEIAMRGDGAAGSGRRVYGDFAARMRLSYGWRVVPVAALAVSVAVVFLLLLPRYRVRMAAGDAWSMADPLGVGLSAVWAFVACYALASVVGYYAITVAWLRRLFREIRLRVQPLHPDGAGGLGSLGGLSIRVSYLVTVVGLLLAITAVTREYYFARLGIPYTPTHDIAIAIALYAIGSPVVFFALPAVAHQTMRGAKNALLLDIGEMFEREYLRLKSALASEAVPLKEGLERLQQLQNLYDMTRRFPVWPFNVENLRRFAATFISPIVLALATNVLLRLLIR
jgi:hypothetical protein